MPLKNTFISGVSTVFYLGPIPKFVVVFIFSPTRPICTAHLIHLFAVQH